VLGKKADSRGNKVAWLYAATRNENACGVNLRWASNTDLLVEYLQARDERLEKSIVHVADRDVHVGLRNGVTDLAAPAGGMLYNLENRWRSGAH
jgi:hypothetical protein